MEAPTQKLTVGELKFRAMVSDLMTMEAPRMIVSVNNASKARSLRRSFYNWEKRLEERERNFLSTCTFKVIGRTIFIERQHDWVPQEIETTTNVPNSPRISS